MKSDDDPPLLFGWNGSNLFMASSWLSFFNDSPVAQELDLKPPLQ
jgi:hypothetical protein